MGKPVCQTTEDYHKVKNTHVIVALKIKRVGGKKNTEGKKINIRMPMRPFLILRFPHPPHPPTQNMMDGSSSRPTGRCIMELKQGFAGFHIDLFSRPLKMTFIILHSGQEGPIWRKLVAPGPARLTRLFFFPLPRPVCTPTNQFPPTDL